MGTGDAGAERARLPLEEAVVVARGETMAAAVRDVTMAVVRAGDAVDAAAGAGRALCAVAARLPAAAAAVTAATRGGKRLLAACIRASPTRVSVRA